MKWPTAIFPGLLAAFVLANLLFHLEALGTVPDGTLRGQQLALDLVILMISVMAGRLVPGYTRAVGIAVRRPRDPLLERASVVVGHRAFCGNLLLLNFSLALRLAGDLGAWASLRLVGGILSAAAIGLFLAAPVVAVVLGTIVARSRSRVGSSRPFAARSRGCTGTHSSGS